MVRCSFYNIILVLLKIDCETFFLQLILTTLHVSSFNGIHWHKGLREEVSVALLMPSVKQGKIVVLYLQVIGSMTCGV